MPRTTLASLLMALALIAAAVAAQGPRVTLDRVLLETALWGRDYPVVLTHLRALREAGEERLYVFADRAAGAAALSSRPAADARATRAAAAVARPAGLQPRFADLQRRAGAAPAVQIAAMRLRDGDGYHVGLNRTGLQLLAPGLTVEQVKARLGPEERTLKQTIHAEGDRQPTFLTLHIYAGGAVAFAESNMTGPGVVERVVLDVGAAAALAAR